MAKRDGINKKASTEGLVEGVVIRNIVDDVDDPPTEVFRGFEKQPATFVDRLELITPKRPSILKKTTPTLLNSFVNATCSVSLLRDNLKELKELFSKNPELYNTPMAGPDRGMSFKCKICKKNYLNEKKLQNHHENKHMIVYKPKNLKRVSFSDNIIVHEVKEYHKCRKCPRIFESYKLLKSHMKDQHKKRKCYICNYCSKKFVDRMFFKVHIKLHCEVCGLLLPSKSKYLEHKRNVCRVLKLHMCKTCNVTFFKFMDLKDHSYEHISTCYVCDICKDQCSTKCAIAHHIYYLHSKRCKRRNPNLYFTRKLGSESLYLCKFCDESSVDKELIEKHVESLPDLANRTMTGYKDYYFCDQCLKKFDKEQHMLQHKWTHFLKTSDISQLKSKEVTAEDQEIKTSCKINDAIQNSSDDKSNLILKSLLTKETHTKRFYNLRYEKIPEKFQPRVVLDRMKLVKKVTADIAFVDVNSIDVTNETVSSKVSTTTSQSHPVINPQSQPVTNPQSQPFIDPQSHPVISKYSQLVIDPQSLPVINPQSQPIMDRQSHPVINPQSLPVRGPQFHRIIDPVTKKTIYSRHQCQICFKYYTSNSILKRHIQRVHCEKFRCGMCSKEFRLYWQFNDHKCVRYGGAQPIYILSYDMQQNAFTENTNGTSNTSEDEDYLNSYDFDVSVPIVEITEFENELNQFGKNDACNSAQESQSNQFEKNGASNSAQNIQSNQFEKNNTSHSAQGIHSNQFEKNNDSNSAQEIQTNQIEKNDASHSAQEIQSNQFVKNNASNSAQEIQRIYNINEKIPDNFQPKVVLERLNLDKMLANFKAFGNENICNSFNGNMKKTQRAAPKKTIMSKHQCPHCGKYYSTNYCLNRHIEGQHGAYDKLQCKVCEEVFVWPSLLQKHKCIRLHIPEMPFDDARPEIHFDNIHAIQRHPFESVLNPEMGSQFDDLNIIESDNYMNAVDFEIPAPIVELTEYQNNFAMNQVNQYVSDKTVPLPLQSLGYKVVHEVPIEF